MPPVNSVSQESFLMVEMGCKNVWHTLSTDEKTDEKTDKKYRKYSLLYFFLFGIMSIFA